MSRSTYLLLSVFCFVTVLSVMACYYRYVVMRDFIVFEYTGDSIEIVTEDSTGNVIILEDVQSATLEDKTEKNTE